MTEKNRNTIEESWKDFSSQLFGYIISKVHHKEDAEDILQEVYLKSVQNIDSLKEGSNINAWLYKVTSNAINDHFRKQKGMIQEEFKADIFAADKKWSVQDNFCCLEPHINELPDKYRSVIKMSEFEGLKYDEIADRLSMSVSAIKSRVVRGREMLKEKFVDCCQYHVNEEGKLIGEPDCQRPECNDCA